MINKNSHLLTRLKKNLTNCHSLGKRNYKFKRKNGEKNIMSYIEEELSFYDFAKKFLDLNDMENPVNLDISSLGIEIQSLLPNGNIDFMPMDSFIVKEKVNFHYRLGDLKGTSQHKVLYNNEYIKLENHPDAIKVEEEMFVVDTSVDETQNYIANGHVNHNTTPGGECYAS